MFYCHRIVSRASCLLQIINSYRALDMDVQKVFLTQLRQKAANPQFPATFDVLKDIQDGTFARNWMDEYASGSENYQAMLKARRDHRIEQVGSRLRDRMSWLQSKSKAQQAA